ncbi:MAG: hypothetical protein ACRDJL_09720 [Actinomycetota bacterium]
MTATFEVGLICGHVVDVPAHGSKHRDVSVGRGWLCRKCDGVRTIVEIQGQDEIDAIWHELVTSGRGVRHLEHPGDAEPGGVVGDRPRERRGP